MTFLERNLSNLDGIRNSKLQFFEENKKYYEIGDEGSEICTEKSVEEALKKFNSNLSDSKNEFSDKELEYYWITV